MAKKTKKKAAKKAPRKKPAAKKKTSATKSRPAAKKSVAKKPVARKKTTKKAKVKSKAPAPRVTKKQKKVAKPQAAAAPPPPPVGSFVWHELMTTDAARVGDFYQGMFNWSRNEMEIIPGVNYTIFRNGSKDSAGMMNMAGPDWEGQPPRWIPYVKVKDVDAAIEKARLLGGRVVVPTSEIPQGQFAVVADPLGVTIGVFTPNEN